LDSGRIHEALDMYRSILELQRTALGGDHPDTLITCVNLAVALAGNGDLAEAEVLLMDTISAYQRIFGTDDHPSLLTARYHLAGLKERNGEWEAALSSYDSILNAQVGKLGTDHPDAIATRLSISRVLE